MRTNNNCGTTSGFSHNNTNMSHNNHGNPNHSAPHINHSMHANAINNHNMITRAFPLRILVQSEVVGAIIGRSGTTIKTITQQTRARIDVHREESPDQQEKLITINGAPDSCSEACFKIMEVIQNELRSKYDGAADLDRDMTLKILASSNLIGRLIGKNGSTIKKMMEQTSTRINISTNSITESTGEHTIVVVGKLEQVLQAEQLISSKLRSAYMSDMNTSMHAMSQQPYLFNNVLLPYMPSPYSQNSILASIVNPQGGHGGNAMPRTMPLPTPHQGQMSSSMYTANPSNYLPLYPSSNVQPTASGLMGYNPVAPGFEQERETVYIYIPSSMVGAIIGKSGAAIKEMISTSGASIKVATAPLAQESQCAEQTQDNNLRAELNDSNPDEPSSKSSTGENSAPSISTTTSPRVPRYQSEPIDLQSMRKVTIVGYPASQYSAQYMIYRKISMECGKGDISLMVEIYVPSHLVGKIIGKGGLTVKAIQKQTRTTIRLPEDKPSPTNASSNNNGETCLRITGEFEGSQAAQRHIKSMIKESSFARQTRPQHYKNNESNATRNNDNAQSDNHQQSEDEDASTPHNPQERSLAESNEKSTGITIQEEIQNPPRKKSPSLSCNNDCGLSKQEEESHPNSQISPGGNDEERDRVGNDVLSNNNKMINNLNSNSSKQPAKGFKLKGHAGGARKNDGDSRESQVENGETTHPHNKTTPL